MSFFSGNKVLSSCNEDSLLTSLCGKPWTFSTGHALFHKIEEALLLFGIEDLLRFDDVRDDFPLNLILNVRHVPSEILYAGGISVFCKKIYQKLFFAFHDSSEFCQSPMKFLGQGLHLCQLKI